MDESTVESSIEAVVGLTEKVTLRVLHVDDDSGFLKVAQQCLKMQGAFEVETATSVEEAMEKMRKKTFEVIVSDYLMPGKDGLEFLKELRDSGNTVPFIMFTGKGREEVAIKALNLGADQYLNKLGDPETVYCELAHGIHQAAERKATFMEVWRREQRLRAVLASSPDIITASDLQGKIVDCNEAAWKLMGFSSKKELLGKSSFEFIAEKDRERALENLKKTLAQGTVRNIEYTLLNKDGEEYIGELSASILKDASGNPIGFVGVVRDITERNQAEEKLSKSETRFRSLVEDTSAGIITVDIEGRFAFVNKAICRMIGYSEKELLDKPFVDFIHPEDKARILQIFWNFMTYPEQRPSFDFGVIHKNGHTVHLHSTPTLFKHGEKIVGSHAILTDITERKKAEEALLGSEEKSLLRDYSERIKELRCLYKMSKLVEKPGVSLEEILQGTTNLLPFAWQYPDGACARIILEDRQFITKNFKETRWKQRADIKVHGKRAGTVEAYYLEKKPTVDEVPFLREERDLLDAIAERIGRITERKKIEDALRRSEEKYKRIVELAPDSIITANTKGVVTSVNTTFTRLTGFSKDEIVGKHFTKVGTILKRDLPMFLKMFTSILRGKAPKPFEVMWKHKDGTTHPTEIHVTLVKSDGKTIGFQAITRDITEQKKAEETLRDREKSWIGSFNALEDVMLMINKDYTIEKINDEGMKLLGKIREEVTGKKCYQVIHGMDAPCKFCPGKRTLKTGKVESADRYEKLFDKYFSIKSAPILGERGKIIKFVDLMRDITERKKAEEELRSSEERLKILFDFAPDAYYLNDLKGNFVDGNKAAEELTCYNKSELVGKSFLKLRLLSRRHVPKAAKLLAKNAFGKPTGPDEFVLNRKDGTQVPVEIRTYPVKIKGQTLVLGIARDITERKKAEKELKKTLEKLQVLNEKLGVVGRLTRHDVRNKLSAITGNAYLARQKLADDHNALKYLGEIESALRQIERIFDFARNYEKLGVEELAYVDVEKSLGEAVSVFSDLHGAKVVNGCRGLTVLADSLLRQLFYNLIHNSLRHGEKVSQIKVYYEETGKDKLRLVYEDDGVGTPKAEKEKIFKEGYGKDTGYGLYLIRKICEVYGWTIRETGKPGKGAQFTITMPQGNENGKENYRLP